VVVLAMVGEAGVTLMETRLGDSTATVELPETVSKKADTVAAPGVTAETRPALLAAATAGTEEDQVATALTSCVLPSLNVPVAVNCWNKPTTREGLTGVTASETALAFVTARPADALKEPDVAVITVLPA
jgi:hypothetical protein